MLKNIVVSKYPKYSKYSKDLDFFVSVIDVINSVSATDKNGITYVVDHFAKPEQASTVTTITAISPQSASALPAIFSFFDVSVISPSHNENSETTAIADHKNGTFEKVKILINTDITPPATDKNKRIFLNKWFFSGAVFVVTE